MISHDTIRSTEVLSGRATASEILALGERHLPVEVSGTEVDRRALRIDRTLGPWVCWSRDGKRRWTTKRTLYSELGIETRDFSVAVPARGATLLRSPSAAQRLKPTTRVLRLLRLESQDVWVVLVYGVALGLLSLAVPIAVQSLVNTVAFGSLIQPLVVISVLLLLALCASAYLRALQVRVVEMLQRRIFVRVVAELGLTLPRVNSEAFRTSAGPELLNRFFDIFTTQKSLASLLLGGLDAVLIALVGMLVLAFYHPILLLFDMVLIAIAVMVFVLLGRRGGSTSIAESKAKYAVAGWLEDLARHPLTFKLGGGENFARFQTDALSRKYLARRDEHFRIVFRQLKGALGMQVVASVALLSIGGYLVISRQLSIGQLVAAELIVTAVVASIAKLGNKVEVWFDLLAAIDKVGEILDLDLEVSRGHDLLGEAEQSWSLRVNALPLSLADEPDPERGHVHVSFEVKPRQTLIVSGLHVREAYAVSSQLFGMVPVAPGKLFFGEHDMSDIELQDWRKHVALIRHEEVLPTSIRENITVANPSLSGAEIWALLERVRIAHRVRLDPEGLHANAERLAGIYGRRFAISLTLARVLASEPDFVVLDGAIDVLNGEQCDDLLRSWSDDPPAGLLVLSDDASLISEACDHLHRPVDEEVARA